MEKVVDVDSVRTFETSGGNTRFVILDADGNEYTTFRPAIGDAAQQADGKRARIEYHEQQRGNFTNVYLDAIEPVAGDGEDDRDPEEAVEPDELFDKLKPFKDRVSEDIRSEPEEG